ncbi:MAG: sigma-70 family RNA polymerase sigma factor [Deltaproteobacteria bacterium]|nr:sigma-70 family RNA polymerase sigma factor [Deltaproteobacteria bacterium]
MDAFGTFYQSHRERLYGYLVRLSGDPELARDLVQDSFIRYMSAYDKEVPAAPLLYTIARNAFIDHVRKKRMDHREIDQETAAGPERSLLVREEYRLVIKALQRLDSDERDILSLAVSSGLSYREIASVTGLSEMNVKVKVHRARQKLRQLLGEMHQ